MLRRNNLREIDMEHKTEEGLITAWVQLTGILKNTRITKGLEIGRASCRERV